MSFALFLVVLVVSGISIDICSVDLSIYLTLAKENQK